MKLNAPFGFFGAGNIGDESTLQGFAKLISQYGNGFEVWVASRNPAHTKKAEPAFRYYKSQGRDLWRRWARFRSSAEVIVGGTPIMDNLGKWPLSELTPLIKAAQEQQRQVVFVGSGIEGLKKEESRRIIAEEIGPVVRHWTVRSDRDKQRLLDYGVAGDRVTVAADLAWTLDAATDRFGRELLGQMGLQRDDYLVGVNLTGEGFVLDQEPELFSKMAKFLDALVEERNSRVLFFANEVREGEGYDKAAATRTIALMKHQGSAYLIPNVYRTPQQTLSLIDCCDLTVSMRYHFCLFSALQGVPFIALKRSDKVDDLCWDLNWPYGVFPTDLDPEVLLGMGLGIEQDRAAVADRLQQQVKSMRQRTLENSAALDALGS